ncbi:hypothetical protein BaRGS_00008706 [Batillaria attramentaria]|uniref:Uncharacterized protein n=1 Tax=Batillaria attramentaria TaxID=370345 RepID=A0ABD0LKX0_9CAEN
MQCGHEHKRKQEEMRRVRANSTKKTHLRWPEENATKSERKKDKPNTRRKSWNKGPLSTVHLCCNQNEACGQCVRATYADTRRDSEKQTTSAAFFYVVCFAMLYLQRRQPCSTGP